MRGKLIILAIIAIACVFLNFRNNTKVVSYYRQLENLEQAYKAELNINTELKVEYGDLRSGKHIASLVRVEMNQFFAQKEEGRVIYVHEPKVNEKTNDYCIIDLIATKAEAKNLNIILD